MGCTLIGCDSAVEVSVAGPDSGTYQMDVCVADTCSTSSFEVTEQTRDEVYVSDVGVTFGDAAFSNPAWVTVTIFDASGSPQLSTDQEIEFERWRPNGWLCPPVCWFGRVSI